MKCLSKKIIRIVFLRVVFLRKIAYNLIRNILLLSAVAEMMLSTAITKR